MQIQFCATSPDEKNWINIQNGWNHLVNQHNTMFLRRICKDKLVLGFR